MYTFLKLSLRSEKSDTIHSIVFIRKLLFFCSLFHFKYFLFSLCVCVGYQRWRKKCLLETLRSYDSKKTKIYKYDFNTEFKKYLMIWKYLLSFYVPLSLPSLQYSNSKLLLSLSTEIVNERNCEQKSNIAFDSNL